MTMKIALLIICHNLLLNVGGRTTNNESYSNEYPIDESITNVSIVMPEFDPKDVILDDMGIPVDRSEQLEDSENDVGVWWFNTNNESGSDYEVEALLNSTVANETSSLELTDLEVASNSDSVPVVKTFMVFDGQTDRENGVWIPIEIMFVVALVLILLALLFKGCYV